MHSFTQIINHRPTPLTLTTSAPTMHAPSSTPPTCSLVASTSSARTILRAWPGCTRSSRVDVVNSTYADRQARGSSTNRSAVRRSGQQAGDLRTAPSFGWTRCDSENTRAQRHKRVSNNTLRMHILGRQNEHQHTRQAPRAGPGSRGAASGTPSVCAETSTGHQTCVWGANEAGRW